MSGVAAAFSLSLHFAIRPPTRPVTPRIHSGSRPRCHSKIGAILAVHARWAAPPILPFLDMSKVRPFTGRTPPTRPASVHSAGAGGRNPPHCIAPMVQLVLGHSCPHFHAADLTAQPPTGHAMAQRPFHQTSGCCTPSPGTFGGRAPIPRRFPASCVAAMSPPRPAASVVLTGLECPVS